MNIAVEISKHAYSRPEAVAIHLPDRSLTFRELDVVAKQLAGYFAGHGISAGNVVALSCLNELPLLVAMLAVARTGATVFSLPRNMPPVLKAEMAARAKACIVAADHAAENIAGLPTLAFAIETLTNSILPQGADPAAAASQAPWLIISGSGSTGEPKLFAVTHDQFLERMRLAGKMLSLSPADRLASLVHLDFTSPKERCLAALHAGASVVLFDRRQPDPISICKKHGVTVLDATVFHIEQLLAALPTGAKQRLSFLRALQLSASTVSDGLRQRIVAALTPALYVRYGTNEVGPIASAPPREVLQTPGTVGYPPDGVQIEIVDGQDRPMPPDQAGLIRVRSPGMVDRYLDDETATRSNFREGWFYTGDLGKLDANGQLVFCGRTDNLMIMNGINIHPAEIERVVSQHPAVRDVAVIPFASTIHQDLPVCAVVLQPGLRVGERELISFAFQKLGSHSPARIVVLERIPRNEQGKPIRPRLMQEITAQLQKGAPRDAGEARTDTNILGPARLKLRQPARQLRLRCPFKCPLDLGPIDTWLESALETRVSPCNALPPRHGDPTDSGKAALTWRILLAFRALMQAARIPIFDTGCVLRIDATNDSLPGWIATAAVPRIDHLSPNCYAIASEGAVEIIRWMMEKPCTAENTVGLYEMIQQRILPPLQRMFSSGKSTIHVLRAAHADDIPFAHLGAGVFQLGYGSRIRRIDRSTTDNDSAIGSKLAQNKVWSADLIRQAGLPAPQHVLVVSEQEAKQAADQLGWPVVVKPSDRDRGEGVTVDIRDDAQLLAALKTAKGASRTRKVIVERAVSGVCHRLFIAKGQLLYAVKRLPKSIHGDGEHSVAALIQAANRRESARPPWLRSERYPDDPLAVEAMAAAGFTLDSVPAAGERVPLRNIESTAWGGFDEDMTERIHPDNLDIAIRAAVLFDLEVAGIDIITPDISRPWHENGAIINEVNFAPLLGGGEISRSHIAEFLARLVVGDGRIPVEVFLGSDAAFAAAIGRQKELVADNLACYLTTDATTLTPSGTEMPLPFKSFYQRSRALLMNRRVEAIILVVQTDEILRAGLPMDRIDRLTVAGNSLLRARMQNAFERLRQLLGQYQPRSDRR